MSLTRSSSPSPCSITMSLLPEVSNEASIYSAPNLARLSRCSTTMPPISGSRRMASNLERHCPLLLENIDSKASAQHLCNVSQTRQPPAPARVTGGHPGSAAIISHGHVWRCMGIATEPITRHPHASFQSYRLFKRRQGEVAETRYFHTTLTVSAA